MKFNIETNLKYKSGIYKISNSIDDRVYVGSSKNFRKRYNRHLLELERNIHHCGHLQNFYNKHKEAELVFELLEVIENPTKALMEERENYYLSIYKNKFNSTKYAFTMLGFKFSEESVRIMKEKITRTHNTPEFKKRHSEIFKKIWQDNDYVERRQKSHLVAMSSKEYANNMSEIIKKRWENPEYKERVLKSKRLASAKQEVKDKISKAFKLKWQDESYREKLKDRGKGEKNKSCKINISIAKNIKILLKEGGKTHQEIANILNINKTTVADISRGRTWKWVSIDD